MESVKTYNRKNLPALITYAIALVLLIAGLVVPLYNLGGEKVLLVAKLGDVFKGLTGTDGIFFGHPIKFFGMGKALDFMSIVILLYVATCGLGIIALVPVIIGSLRGKNYANGFAYAIEGLGVVVTALYLLVALPVVAVEKLSYNMLFPLGGLVAMIVLSCINKKGSAGVKVLIFILSAIAFLMLFNLVTVFGKAGEKIGTLSEKIKSNALWYGPEVGTVDGSTAGITLASLLFETKFMEVLKLLPTVKEKLLIIMGMALATLVIINFILDLFNIAHKETRGKYILHSILYAVQLALAIALCALVFVCKFKIGLLFYVLALMTVVIFLIYVIRAATAKSREAKKDKKIKSRPYEGLYGEADVVPVAAATPAPAPAPVAPAKPVQPQPPVAPVAPAAKPVQPQPPTPAPAPAPAPAPVKAEPPVVENHNIVYTVNAVYQGPTDDFLNKLTNDEKIEFMQVFVERTKGNLGNMPAYNLGGDNKTFFSNAFIYLGRWRDLISDGLINKMYSEMNML